MPQLNFNNAPIHRIIGRWPELFWIVCVWVVMLPLGWLRYKIDGVPYSLGTVAFYLSCLGCVVVPAWIAGGSKPTTGDWKNPLPTQSLKSLLQFWGSAFALVALMALYFYARREYAGVDVSSMRGERSNIAVTGFEARAYMLLSPFALASVVLWVGQKLPIKIFCAAVFMVFFWKASIISGARFELMPVPLLGALALWFAYSDKLIRNPIRGLVVAGAAFVSVLMVNSFYNIFSTKGGGESGVAAYIRNSGASVFEVLGIRGVPLYLEETMGSMAEYVFAPLIYLDFYLKENQFTPTMGSHQFPALFVRFGFEESVTTKLAVDELYSAIRIYHNVWATGLREILIDFGYKGALFQCVVFGGLLGLSKRMLGASIAAKNLYLILCAYHIATPLVSLFKSRLFEVGFYGAILWFVLENAFKRGRIGNPSLGAPSMTRSGTRSTEGLTVSSDR